MEKRKNQSKNQTYQKQTNRLMAHTREGNYKWESICFSYLKKVKLWIKREKIPRKCTKPNINYQQNKNAAGELPFTKQAEHMSPTQEAVQKNHTTRDVNFCTK